jgi:hypothetical protein
MHARGEPEQEVAVGRSSAAHLSQAAADAAHEMSEHTTRAGNASATETALGVVREPSKEAASECGCGCGCGRV